MRLHLVDEPRLLRVVHRFDRAQDLEIVPSAGRRLEQCLDVFRKAAAAIADPRKQERSADPAIRADRLAHLIDVGADPLADVRNLVHERNARRQNRIRRVFGELGACRVHHQDRRPSARKGSVQLSHDLGRVSILGADDYAIRLHEVFDRRALLQELGVAHDAERLGRLFRDHGSDLLGRPDGHGALVDDHRVLVDRSAHFERHIEHVLQVGGAVVTLRRPDGDEHDFGRFHGGRQVGREAQALFAVIAPDHFLEPWLVDWHLAGLQSGDLRLVLIDTNDGVPVLGEAGSHNETDVSSSDDGDFHLFTSADMARPRTSTRSRSRIGARKSERRLRSLVTTTGRCRLTVATRMVAE